MMSEQDDNALFVAMEDVNAGLGYKPAFKREIGAPPIAHNINLDEGSISPRPNSQIGEVGEATSKTNNDIRVKGSLRGQCLVK